MRDQRYGCCADSSKPGFMIVLLTKMRGTGGMIVGLFIALMI
jgi:hypothetical protein